MTHQSYEIHEETRDSRWLITCDHASNAVPPEVNGGDLGLPHADMNRHIAYDLGAAAIAEALDQGQDVVCLCEGDPFFYGSFMYLHARLADRYSVEVIPGVTSLTACAARAGLPIAARNERVTVLPGPLPETELRQRIEGAESVVVMKVGRHLAKIRGVIADLGLLDQAVYVERASLPEERICPLVDAPEKAPYFSMILLTKGADPWL